MERNEDYFFNEEQLDLLHDSDRLESYGMQLRSIKGKLLQMASENISVHFQIRFKQLLYEVLDCEQALQGLMSDVYRDAESDWLIRNYRQFEVQFEKVSCDFFDFSSSVQS